MVARQCTKSCEFEKGDAGLSGRNQTSGKHKIKGGSGVQQDNMVVRQVDTPDNPEGSSGREASHIVGTHTESGHPVILGTTIFEHRNVRQEGGKQHAFQCQRAIYQYGLQAG